MPHLPWTASSMLRVLMMMTMVVLMCTPLVMRNMRRSVGMRYARLVSVFLVARMRDPIVLGHKIELYGRHHPRGGGLAGWTCYGLLKLSHRAPRLEGAAGLTKIVVNRHFYSGNNQL